MVDRADSFATLWLRTPGATDEDVPPLSARVRNAIKLRLRSRVTKLYLWNVVVVNVTVLTFAVILPLCKPTEDSNNATSPESTLNEYTVYGLWLISSMHCVSVCLVVGVCNIIRDDKKSRKRSHDTGDFRPVFLVCMVNLMGAVYAYLLANLDDSDGSCVTTEESGLFAPLYVFLIALMLELVLLYWADGCCTEGSVTFSEVTEKDSAEMFKAMQAAYIAVKDREAEDDDSSKGEVSTLKANEEESEV